MNILLRVLRLLAGPSRLRIVDLLSRSRSPLSVQQIAKEVNLTHSACSHQLGELFRGEIISYKKRGREIYYTMADGNAATKARLIIRV